MSDRQFQESKRVALARQGWHCMRCGRNLHDPSVWPGRSGHHRQLRRRADPTMRDLPCNIVELCGSGTTGCHGWAHAHLADWFTDETPYGRHSSRHRVRWCIERDISDYRSLYKAITGRTM